MDENELLEKWLDQVFALVSKSQADVEKCREDCSKCKENMNERLAKLDKAVSVQGVKVAAIVGVIVAAGHFLLESLKP